MRVSEPVRKHLQIGCERTWGGGGHRPARANRSSPRAARLSKAVWCVLRERHMERVPRARRSGAQSPARAVGPRTRTHVECVRLRVPAGRGARAEGGKLRARRGSSRGTGRD
eukprot:2287508-Prymnesium_polylepis.1